MNMNPRGAPRSAWTSPGWLTDGPRPGQAEVWCYTDRWSYRPGDTVLVHMHTSAQHYDLTIIRDGATPETVWSGNSLEGTAQPTPYDAYARGCGWPAAVAIEIPADWKSAFYLLVIGADFDGRRVENEHFFVVRSPAPGQRTPYVFLLTTSTLTAYNDWGGANHYRGRGDDPLADIPSPILSTQRPVSRGLLRKPDNAPRSRSEFVLGPFDPPRYPVYEWARKNGYSRHHQDASWSGYERPFAVWAENHGYALDYLTQADLHEDSLALGGYRCVIIVGHDEYWTWEMRDRIDDFVDAGGNVARFAGNFLWQVRLEGTTQIAYKTDVADDPVLGTAREHLLTTHWDDPRIGRPGAATFGLTGNGGTYAGYGVAVPRGHGGLQVYRPDHWTLAGTDLYYGDIIGAAPSRVGTFEVDGCDYTVQAGIPYATGVDGAPTNLDIVAMGPAVSYEEDRFDGEVPLGDSGSGGLELLRDVEWTAPQSGRPTGIRAIYGAGMMASFERGAGMVFNSGTCEWVAGLIHRDWYVERITDNVLRRLGAADETFGER